MSDPPPSPPTAPPPPPKVPKELNEGSLRFKNRLIARLRRAIKRRGQTVASVERRLGRSRGYVGDALRERKDLTIELLTEVLDALHIDVDDFMAERID